MFSQLSTYTFAEAFEFAVGEFSIKEHVEFPENVFYSRD